MFLLLIACEVIKEIAAIHKRERADVLLTSNSIKQLSENYVEEE